VAAELGSACLLMGKSVIWSPKSAILLSIDLIRHINP
jgi:hypothetical protein